jgi:hypothetical protein
MLYGSRGEAEGASTWLCLLAHVGLIVSVVQRYMAQCATLQQLLCVG